MSNLVSKLPNGKSAINNQASLGCLNNSHTVDLKQQLIRPNALMVDLGLSDCLEWFNRKNNLNIEITYQVDEWLLTKQPQPFIKPHDVLKLCELSTSKYATLVAEFINNQVIPFINQNKPNDDSKGITVKHQIKTFTYNKKPIAFDVADQIMVNATQMAIANDKKINDFLRLQTTEEYIKELSTVTGIPVTELVVIKQGGKADQQGTWVNRKIAIRVAQWASAKFAVQVDMWIEELMTTGKVSIQPEPEQKPVLKTEARTKAINA